MHTILVLPRTGALTLTPPKSIMTIECQPDSQEPHVQIRMSRRERTQPNDSILEIYRTLASPLSYPS